MMFYVHHNQQYQIRRNTSITQLIFTNPISSLSILTGESSMYQSIMMYDVDGGGVCIVKPLFYLKITTKKAFHIFFPIIALFVIKPPTYHHHTHIILFRNNFFFILSRIRFLFNPAYPPHNYTDLHIITHHHLYGCKQLAYFPSIILIEIDTCIM